MSSNKRRVDKNELFLTHSIEIKPNKSCIKLFNRCFGYRRYCYNRAVEMGNVWRNLYKDLNFKKNEGDTSITDEMINNLYPDFFRFRDTIKRSGFKKYSWEEIFASTINDSAIEDYTRGYEMFMKGIKEKPPTEFKKKNKSTDSFRINMKNDFSIIVSGKTLRLTKIPYIIRMTEELRFDGAIQNCTIIRHSDRYFAVFCIRLKNKAIFKMRKILSCINKKESIGIDVGIKTMLTLGRKSIDEFRKIDDLYEKLIYYMNRARKYDSIMNRKVYMSNNYIRTRTKLRRVYRRIFNIRNHYLHLLSKFLVFNYKNICMEDFKIKEWFRDIPKAANKARRKLNHLGLYTLKYMISYKSKLYNSNLILADRKYPSTQRCSDCGYVLINNERLRLNDRVFKCPSCGFTHDRDVNAAYNLDIYANAWLEHNHYSLIDI